MATQFARGFSLPPEGTTADRIITVCGWCQELNILKLPRKPNDLVMVMWQDGQVRAYKNGEPMYASHGVCPEHHKQLLASPQVEPLCLAEKDSFRCNRPLGHAGDHWQQDPSSGGRIGWSNVTEKPVDEHPEWHADGWTGKR